jgi:hypothetical protein
VRERVLRRHNGRKYGLLASLVHDELRDEVQQALAQFDAETAGARALTNYALHAGSIPGGGTPLVEISQDNEVVFVVPDLPSEAVVTWDEFEFDEHRDALEVVAVLRRASERLVDAVLAAFDVHLPND